MNYELAGATLMENGEWRVENGCAVYVLLSIVYVLFWMAHGVPPRNVGAGSRTSAH
jgi:hypothetical protein